MEGGGGEDRVAVYLLYSLIFAVVSGPLPLTLLLFLQTIQIAHPQRFPLFLLPSRHAVLLRSVSHRLLRRKARHHCRCALSRSSFFSVFFVACVFMFFLSFHASNCRCLWRDGQLHSIKVEAVAAGPHESIHIYICVDLTCCTSWAWVRACPPLLLLYCLSSPAPSPDALMR